MDASAPVCWTKPRCVRWPRSAHSGSCPLGISRQADRAHDLRRLSDEGLITCETLADVDGSRRIATLTPEGKELVEAHRHPEREGPDQVFYSGVVKPGELAHDAQVYRAFSEEAARIDADGGRVTRVILDYELKRDDQRFLHREDRPEDATLESDRRAFAEAHVARRRFQKGQLFKSGRRRKVWVGR